MKTLGREAGQACAPCCCRWSEKWLALRSASVERLVLGAISTLPSGEVPLRSEKAGAISACQKCLQSFPAWSQKSPYPFQDKASESNAVVQKSASLSVAQLAGKFQDQPPLSGKEIPADKPARRKPPCSLPLHPHKTELGQNGELKPSPNASHPPRVKVKSSPMIEKLQANLAFAPASLLPGASPKSPGLKVMVSPFNSPATTPSSTQIQSHANESKETPVGFDQPPEGTHLQFYNKVRTRGSIKRRPPSRRFRKSQSESDDQDLGVTLLPQENGAREEESEDGVFVDKSKTVKSLSPTVDGVDHNVKQNRSTSDEKTLLDQKSGRTANKEEELGTEKETLDKDCTEEKSHQNAAEENPYESIKKNKETNPGCSTADNMEGESCKTSLLDKEVDNGSEQRNEDKGERGDKFCESENIKQRSDSQDTGTPQPAGDTTM
ncbi:capZ-interacting protein [Eublepharis macularius]|uniref:CapZ-interacting protein n=1 Tax=Eublepharis macularius TaxID=481883 RepID=A0AA97J3J0_EUBMA|nr:capZ-interacting protein [Eublepharis macularius]